MLISIRTIAKQLQGINKTTTEEPQNSLGIMASFRALLMKIIVRVSVLKFCFIFSLLEFVEETAIDLG